MADYEVKSLAIPIDQVKRIKVTKKLDLNAIYTWSGDRYFIDINLEIKFIPMKYLDCGIAVIIGKE